MDELIINVLAAFLFFAGLFAIVCLGGVFHKAFFKDENNKIQRVQ